MGHGVAKPGVLNLHLHNDADVIDLSKIIIPFFCLGIVFIGSGRAHPLVLSSPIHRDPEVGFLKPFLARS